MDPRHEHTYIAKTYPRRRWWSYCIWAATLLALIAWNLTEGGGSRTFAYLLLTAFVVNEIRNHRLRRNAREFSEPNAHER